jgi:hypothetical protein
MRSVAEWDESDLLALIRDEVQESLSLDYKRSAALGKNDKERNDLSKDVSAFANSEGGMLIYGIQENRHVPTAVDVGVDRTQLTKEWLESVVKTNIHPTVDRLLIKQISLPSKGANAVAYVLEIGQATSRAPHQAFDHRYYKRFNFESTPMEDYEVRDLLRRSIEYGKKYSAAWNLSVEVQRLLSAINERCQIDGGDYLPRDRLIVRISDDLRSAGDVIVLLAKPLRNKVAELINKIDQFNSEIETVDPGRREEARLNKRLKSDLADAFAIGTEISSALREILDREP